MTRPIVHTRIFSAPVDKVWDAITDFEQYPKWNRFSPKVECDFRVGGRITMYAHLTPGRTPTRQTERIFEITPPTRFRYGINYGLLFRTDRTQLLTALPNGNTEYQSTLTMRGILAPLVLWKYRAAIEAGFALSLDGLAHYLGR